MMNQLAVPRKYLRGPNPLAFREICGDHKILVQVPSSRHQKALTNIDHEVRRPETPTFDERGSRGQIPWITFRHAFIYPGPDDVDLLLCQTRIICELAVSGICEPGRHLARQHRCPNSLRPRPC